MKRSKHCYNKGGGHRLSKEEYVKQSGYNSSFVEKKLGEIEQDTYMKYPISELKKWSYAGLQFTLEQYKCRCGDNPTRMYVTSTSDIDWSIIAKEEYDTITREAINEGHFDNIKDVNNYVKQIDIYFACEECIMRRFNGGFHMHGNLNQHFIRNGNKWYHYEDSNWLKIGKSYPDYDNIKHDFIMTSKNYKRILKAMSGELIKKRNFTFIFLGNHSMRLTGFCTLCEQPYNRYAYPVCSINKCICTHRKEMHYYDNKWDKLFVEYNKEKEEKKSPYNQKWSYGISDYIRSAEDDMAVNDRPKRCIDIMLDEFHQK